jgi:hypothetical protein
VEAALVLPVFALLLIALLFLLRWYQARDDARGLARRCAFEHAIHGCTDIPPGCAEVLAGARNSGDRVEAQALRGAAAAGDSFGVLDLPLISDAIDTLFGSATRAQVARRVRRPWDSAEARASGDFVVLCNDRPREVGPAIKQVFCDRVPAIQCR